MYGFTNLPISLHSPFPLLLNVVKGVIYQPKIVFQYAICLPLCQNLRQAT